LISLFSKLF